MQSQNTSIVRAELIHGWLVGALTFETDGRDPWSTVRWGEVENILLSWEWPCKTSSAPSIFQTVWRQSTSEKKITDLSIYDHFSSFSSIVVTLMRGKNYFLCCLFLNREYIVSFVIKKNGHETVFRLISHTCYCTKRCHSQWHLF